MARTLSTVYRVLAGVLLILLLAAAANYYLDLGWFGIHGSVVLSMVLLAVGVFVIAVIRHDQSAKASRD
jgi:hypothetical protein